MIRTWLRYIDDVFVISTSPLNELATIANTVNSAIRFTHEEAQQGSLPFLDTTVTYVTAASTFSTALYVKPCHSNTTLHFDSHVPLQRKINLLRSERLRAERNSSTPAVFERGLRLLRARFLSNGYPVSLVARHLMSAQGRTPCRRHGEEQQQSTVFLRIPFVNSTYEHQVRALLNRADLPVRLCPSFVTPRPLSTQLQRRQPLPCGGQCVCQGRHLCLKKNLVYQITCTVCGGKYIGETHRTYRTRILEHVATNSSSNVFRHFVTRHNTQPQLDCIQHCVLRSAFADTLQRKAFEAEMIRQRQPVINVQMNLS